MHATFVRQILKWANLENSVPWNFTWEPIATAHVACGMHFNNRLFSLCKSKVHIQVLFGFLAATKSDIIHRVEKG